MATHEIKKNFSEIVTSYEKILIAVLFFVWGLLTQLNDLLVPFLHQIFELSLTEALLIHFTFFTTYLVAAYPAGKLIDAIGYKKGISVALLMASIGCVVFFIASEINNFEVFLLALVLIASSVTILQIAGNGYIVLHSEQGLEASELTFAQVFNSFARVIAFLMLTVLVASLMKEVEVLPPDLIKTAYAHFIKKPYLFMAVLVMILAVLFYLSKLPELNTKSLPVLVKNPKGTEYSSVFQIKHLMLASLAIFCYVGAEVSIGTFMSRYLMMPEVGITDENQIMKLIQYFWAAAMIGRIAGGFLLKFISPKKAVVLFSIGAILCTVISLISTGNMAAYSMVAAGLFNSILFPTIFSLGISGLGHFSEEGSSVMIAGVVGGAVIPLLVITLAESIGLHTALLLPVLCYIFVAYYGWKGSDYKSLNSTNS